MRVPGTRAGRAGGACALLIAVLGLSASRAVAQPAAPAEPPRTWTGTGGAGLAVTGGNTDTISYNLAFDLMRDAKTRNVMKWNGLYLRGDRDGSAIVNRTSLAFRDEYELSGRSFLFGQVDYLRDTFKLIDYLVAPTAGLGYRVIDTDATELSVDAGAGGVWEKNPGLGVRTSGALTAGGKLVHQLTSTASIKHATAGLWKTSDFGDSLYTFSIGLSTRISPRAQLSIDLLDTFKNKPPAAGTKKNDVALVTAITAKF